MNISGPHTGAESSGKTTLAFKIASDFIKKEKKRFEEKEEENKKIIEKYEEQVEKAKESGKKAPESPKTYPYEIRHIMFVDAEGTADPEWAKTSSGYDMNDEQVETLYYLGKGQTAEQIFQMMFKGISGSGMVVFFMS